MGTFLPVERGRTVLVTGGTGFLGRAVVERLQKDHDVRVASKATGVDVLDLDAFARAARGCDVIVHLAGAPRAAPAESVALAVRGALHAVRVAKAGGARLVLASSAAVYEPVTANGAGKVAAEEVVRDAVARDGLDAAILRIFNPYGGADAHGVVGRWLRADTITIHGDGTQVRDFVHVDDIAEAIALALAPEGLAESDVGTGHGTTLLDLARLVDKPVTHAPPPAREIRESVARHVRIPGWRPRVDLAAWVARQSSRAASARAAASRRNAGS